jgi:hypothetical protein
MIAAKQMALRYTEFSESFSNFDIPELFLKHVFKIYIYIYMSRNKSKPRRRQALCVQQDTFYVEFDSPRSLKIESCNCAMAV